MVKFDEFFREMLRLCVVYPGIHMLIVFHSFENPRVFSLKNNCLIAYLEFIGIHTFQPVNTLHHMNLRHPSC